jgi:thiosulfate dehydrogenase
MSEIFSALKKAEAVLLLVVGILFALIALVVCYDTRKVDRIPRTSYEYAFLSNNKQGDTQKLSSTLPAEDSSLVSYGLELISHTSKYLGPNGNVASLSNGMNCQNCHLDAGTKLFAANYNAVASTYPKFRHRSGTVEDIARRINDCFQRSLNGQPLAISGREMRAIVAYIRWVGRDVKKGEKPTGTGLLKLPFLNRAADTVRGKQLYARHCSNCHGTQGQGMMADNALEWKYPPLWGAHSYNTGAGLYRISNLAGFIKANMPYGATYQKPLVTDDDAWDIAAFVNSMPRPYKHFPGDWPDVRQKPFDHPFGPYDDKFSEAIHKYGPFEKIIAAKK